MLPTFLQTVIPQLETATIGHWQIVCVDDGSQDGTLDVIAAAHADEPRVTGIKLSRNFGHQAAVSVGLAFASGDYIGVMDCDLQDPIEVLIHLYDRAVRDGLDVCYGIRARRQAPLLLKLGYWFFYRLIDRVADYHWPKDAGDFSVISSKCHAILLALPERSRMVRGLRAWVGLKQAGIPYDRPQRARGSSKYNLWKLCSLALHGLIAFSNIPLRLASIIGLIMGAGSILVGILAAVNRLFPHVTVLGYWVGANPGITTLLCFLALVFSVLFVSLGIIGEYLVVLLQEVKRRPTAIVDNVVGALHKNTSAEHVIHVIDPSGTTPIFRDCAGLSE
jgi:dolichol-phosphate mannosyltransferase